MCFDHVKNKRAMLTFFKLQWSLCLALFLFVSLAACGQSSTGSLEGEDTQTTSPTRIRLLFSKKASGKNLKQSALSPDAITAIRITASADGLEPISKTIDRPADKTVRTTLDLPINVDLNILAEILDIDGRVLLMGRTNILLSESGQITILIAEPIIISADPVTVSTGATSNISLALSEAFLEGVGSNPSISWGIEEDDGLKGSITPNQNDITTAIYTAPNDVPEPSQVNVTAVSNDNANVFETVTLTVVPSTPIPTFPLTVTTTGLGSGTVTSSPPGINCGTDCTEFYDEDTVVTLTATPDPGSTFSDFFFQGDSDCQDGTVTMSAARNCEARFTPGDLSVSIKLTWGESPTDLDSHLVGPGNFRISFGSEGNLGVSPFARLDVDDTDGFGPEVISVVKFETPGIYTYSVHDFGEEFDPGVISTITDSPARVELSIDGVNTVFTPPPGQTPSDFTWKVFEFVVDADLNVTVNTIGSWQAGSP